MPDYLLLIALGPVQDFIMTARSSGDLWLGSTLLSACSKAVALTIAEKEKSTDSLIFPAPKNIADLQLDSSLNVANVIFARVTHDPKQTAEAARAAIRAVITNYWEKAKKTLSGKVLIDVANQQLEDLIEFYWASTPLTTDYPTSRNRVYAMLNARKTNRNFEAVQWGTNTPKSSLDGTRESIIPENEYPFPKADRTERERFAKQLYKKFGVRIGERLCAVGLLKRRALRGERPGFSSTSHMAVMPLLERQPTDNMVTAKQHLDELKQLIGDTDFLERLNVTKPHSLIGDLDGRILLPERMREAFKNRDDLEQAQNLVRKMIQSAYGNDVKEAPAYYALLHADGDRMGKAIDKQITLEDHQKLSQKLAGFSITAKKIITDHNGCSVFVGGDDVLAYLPVHRALECSLALSQAFSLALEDYAFMESGKTYRPTLSAGLVIAHYLEPLQDTLETARIAEKVAKKTRDSLAITLLKRGGSPITISGQWKDFLPRLIAFREMHRLDLIPDGAAYELRELARTLESIGTDQMVKATKLEAKRILQRKRPKQGTETLKQTIIDQMIKLMNPEAKVDNSESSDTSVQIIANELIVARAFATANDIYDPEKTKIQIPESQSDEVKP